MLIDELLAYLFNGQPHLLAAPMARWLASSRRFSAFVTAFRTKIRKKLRATQETESLLDLRLELETAYLLLQERSLSLVYEPPRGGQMRGPDFAVSFTTSTLFMIEVTRLRTGEDGAHGLVQTQGLALSPHAAPIRSPAGDWLADTVCSKLGQLLPQYTNVLLVGAEAPRLTPDNLRAEMLQLQQRAERNDATIVQRYRFRDRADFFHHYQRLSELLVRGPGQQGEGETVVGWVNPQAKYPLPGKVRTTLYRSLNTEYLGQK
jgi:hypothetical protein